MHVHHRSTPGFAPAAATPPARVGGAGDGPFGADGFGFGDLVDLVNPLHHLPVVGRIYRHLSGDVIAPALRVAGGALFGGPLGAAFAAAGVAVDAVIDGAGGASTAPATLVATPARGGGLVSAARGNGAAPPAETVAKPVEPALATRRPPRRGGWMVAAAYAMADARRAQVDARV